MPAVYVPLPAPARLAAGRSGVAFEAVVDEAVRILKGPRSRWPVDTGRTKRAWRRIGSGLNSQIYNPLHYASYVERRGRPAARTLQLALPRLLVAARRGAPLTARRRSGESLEDVLVAQKLRQLGETERRLYRQYYRRYREQRRRAPTIAAATRELDRLLRIQASRGIERGLNRRPRRRLLR